MTYIIFILGDRLWGSRLWSTARRLRSTARRLWSTANKVAINFDSLVNFPDLPANFPDLPVNFPDFLACRFSCTYFSCYSIPNFIVQPSRTFSQPIS